MAIIPANVLQLKSREFFLFGTRWAFGFWLLYVGLSKWILMGPSNFVGFISKNFAETWAPEPLLLLMGWGIVIAEPLLGLWLIVGTKARLAWIATAKLMFILMIGQTMLQKFDQVPHNWLYFFLALGCAALTEPEE